MNQFDLSVVDQILEKMGADTSSVIAVLQAIQEHYRYIPREVFPRLAEKMGISEARIYSVATFYENFSLEPKGKYVIKICDGTACHVRKSVPILERLRKDLQLSETKHTTDDSLFTVETVSCLGACSIAPAMMVNDKVYPSMSPDSASAVIKTIREEQ